MKKILIILLLFVSSFVFSETYGQSRNRFYRQSATIGELISKLDEIINIVDKSYGKNRNDAITLLSDQLNYTIGYFTGMQGLANNLFDYYGDEVYLSTGIEYGKMSKVYTGLLAQIGLPFNKEKQEQGLSVAMLGHL